MFFLAAIFLSLFKQFLEMLRLYMLLHAKKIHIPLWRVVKIMITGSFIGTLAPTSLGIEIVRAYGFSKHTENSAAAVSAVAINRFIGLLSLMLLASFSIFWEKEYANQVGVVW